MFISYNEAKRQANLAKHGIDLAECAPIFDFPMLSQEDTRESYGEQRTQTIGWLHGEIVTLIWTERADSARLISCRKATPHEARQYRQFLHRGGT